MHSWIRTAALLSVILAQTTGHLNAQVAGVAHRTTVQPSAAVRDAQHRTDLRITVWYPAAPDAVAQPIEIGPPNEPLFIVGSAAPDAPIATNASRKRYPVILLSHGFGGTARIMGWFGTAMAEAGYIVISVDHPGNNGADAMTVPAAFLWWERAEDLKRALDAVSRDPLLGSHIDLDRVGAAGFSAGGFTALVLGGARVDPNRFLRFCEANPDDGVCRPQIEFDVSMADRDRALQDPDVAALNATARDDHSSSRVKVVFAMAPALVQALDPASLLAYDRPVRIITGDADTVVPPHTNASVAAEAIPGARLTALPGAGHYVFLAGCTEIGAARVPVCAQAGPQAEAHRLAVEQAKELFGKYIGDPRN